MKRSQADIYFSKCVRAANEYKCLICEKQYTASCTGLHCSHIFGRRHRTIRWCKDNVQPLCAHHHQWFGENPADSGKWLEEILGEGHLQILREKRDSMVKVSKLEEKEIAKHYKEQLALIEKKRAEGISGYINFESWQ